MRDANSVLDFELDMKKLTPLQRELHGRFPYNADQPAKEVPVESIFHSETIRTGRSPNVPVKLERKPEDDGFVFTADSRMHFLNFTYMLQRLPPIRVLPKYREKIQICWPQNVGLNIVTSADLVSDKTIVQSIDDVWFNMYYQHFMPRDYERAHLDMLVGNLDFLTSWTDYLPPYTLMILQIWDYCRHDIKAFPLYLCKSGELQHKYEMRRDILSLLRVRIRTSDGGWVEIKPSEKSENIMAFLTCPETLPEPELWGYYSKIAKEELEAFSPKDAIYINDCVAIDGDNLCSLGETVTIDLDCGDPCLAIEVVIENTEATSRNNLSNFTTNPDDLITGWSPVHSHQLKYGGMERIPRMDGAHSERMFPLKFARPASQPGYHLIPLSQDPMTLGTDTTTVLKETKGKLILKLGDTDPYQYQQQDDSNSEDDEISSILREYGSTREDNKIYKIRVRLLVVKKLEFRDGVCVIASSNTK